MEGLTDGRFDGFVEASAYGWAWNASQPGEPVRLRMRLDEAEPAEFVADQFREDVRRAGIGNGRHAFTVRLPEAAMDGQPHTVVIGDAVTGQTLPGSPQTFRHDTNPLPWADRANCATVAQRKFAEGVLSYRDVKIVTAWRQAGMLLLRGAVDPELVRLCARDADDAVRRRLPVPVATAAGPAGRFTGVPETASFAGMRFLDMHQWSEAALQVAMLPDVLRLLGLLFEAVPACVATAFRIQGEAAGPMVDDPVVPGPLSRHAVTIYAALEPSDAAAAPLYLHPGSHRLVAPHPEQGDGPGHLQAECDRLGLQREVLELAAGDVAMFHPRLVRGELAATDKLRTRRGLSARFVSERALASHSGRQHRVNGGICYDRAAAAPLPLQGSPEAA